jgi:hypothetical protein
MGGAGEDGAADRQRRGEWEGTLRGSDGRRLSLAAFGLCCGHEFTKSD